MKKRNIGQCLFEEIFRSYAPAGALSWTVTMRGLFFLTVTELGEGGWR